MATVLDTLFVELGLDAKKFQAESKQATQTLDKVTKSATNSEKAIKKIGKTSKKTAKETQNFAQVLGKVHKGLLSFFALATGSNAFVKLASDTAKANVELDNLSKNIGMSGDKLMKWGHMAQMAGGNSQAMTNTLSTLSQSITRLTVMGEPTLIPFFNTLGVSLLDNNGKARDLDKIMLDLADSFGKMERTKAYGLAKSMGFDDDTINTLMLGRAEMQEMLDIQKNIYKSSEQEIKASRELTKAKGLLSAQYESLKLKIGNALVPILTKMVKLVSGFVEFLNAHEYQVKNFFVGIATAIGLVLLPILIKAGLAMLAFAAPILVVVGVVTALGAAFGLLYDDYATWAKGGKSLFDWGKFKQYIDESSLSVDNLKKAFVYLLTGYQSWADAYKNAVDWLKQKGFIDENGVSINSLATGFKNFAKDLLDYVAPALQDVMELLNALRNGDFARAGEMAKNLGKRAINQGLTVGQAMGGRLVGAVDTLLGHDPNDPNSLKSKYGNLINGAREFLGINQLHQDGEKAKQAVTQISQKVANAANYALQNAVKRSIGKCALYVNNALRSQGFKVSGHGKDVAQNLLNSKQGFQSVVYNKDYVPQDGDVMSIDHGRHQYGHVAIYNAKAGKWVSDFVQHKTRGNTAATNDKDFKAIQNGKAKVTIARKIADGADAIMSSIIPQAQAGVLVKQNHNVSKLWEMGQTSKQYESKGGIGTISTGKGDKGGKSYGQYQFALTQGTPQDFVRNTEYGRKHFAGLTVGSAEFDKKWKALAQSDSVNFQKAQHDYTKSRYFDKQINFLKRNGIDLSQRGAGVMDMIWSTAVQFGGESGLIKKILSGKDVNKMSDNEIISAVQDYKLANTETLFKSSPKLWKGLKDRAHNEKQDLLKLSGLNPNYAQQAIAQSQAMQQQSQIAQNKTVNVSINGGVTVQTTANNIADIASDVGQSIRDRVAQLMPAMM